MGCRNGMPAMLHRYDAVDVYVGHRHDSHGIELLLVLRHDMDDHKHCPRAAVRSSEVRARFGDPDGQDSFVGASTTAAEAQAAASAWSHRESASAESEDQAVALAEREAASVGHHVMRRHVGSKS